MAFWTRKKEAKEKVSKEVAKPATEPTPAAPNKKRSGPGARYPLEVKLLAVRASEEGLSPKEISDVIGASTNSLASWLKAYEQGGVEALSAKPESKSANKLCRALEERIEQYRREHPEHGVRRIRDELKRDEAVQVSSETVRRMVNDAGLGQPPIPLRRSARMTHFCSPKLTHQEIGLGREESRPWRAPTTPSRLPGDLLSLRRAPRRACGSSKKATSIGADPARWCRVAIPSCRVPRSVSSVCVTVGAPDGSILTSKLGSILNSA
jgi:transposase